VSAPKCIFNKYSTYPDKLKLAQNIVCITYLRKLNSQTPPCPSQGVKLALKLFVFVVDISAKQINANTKILKDII